MKHFETPEARAVAYAAMKELDRMLKEDGEIDPGFNYDCGMQTLQITIPVGTTVNRSLGQDGQGNVYKKATTNLHGYAVLHEIFSLLKRFKQGKRLERILRVLIQRALKKNISTEDAFRELHPEEYESLQQFKQDLKLPKRRDSTPRDVFRMDKDAYPVLRFLGVKKKNKKAA